jgi:hypothetical protein
MIASSRMKVSIIIPVYIKFYTLSRVLERVIDAPLPEGCEKEIIIDDGSADDTSKPLQHYHDFGVMVAPHWVLSFGNGTAVRVGSAIATDAMALIQDGDLECDFRDYVGLIRPLASGEATVVYRSRFLCKPCGMARANCLANKILTLAASALFGARITDEATDYKPFRAGHRITEVAISYNARGIVEGKKIRWWDGVEALWTLLKYRLAPRSSFLRGPAAVGASAPAGRPAQLVLTPLSIALYLVRRLLTPQAACNALLSTAGLLAGKTAVDKFLAAGYACQSYNDSLPICTVHLVFGLALLRLLWARAARAIRTDYTCLLLTQPAPYYLETHSCGDWFSAYNYGWLIDNASSAKECIAKLRGAGSHYVLVDRRRSGNPSLPSWKTTTLDRPVPFASGNPT